MKKKFNTQTELQKTINYLFAPILNWSFVELTQASSTMFYFSS